MFEINRGIENSINKNKDVIKNENDILNLLRRINYILYNINSLMNVLKKIEIVNKERENKTIPIDTTKKNYPTRHSQTLKNKTTRLTNVCKACGW
jgi:hypothetical protein